MRKHRRIIQTLLSVFVIVGMLSGCSNKGDENIIIEEKTTLQEDEIVLSFLGYKADALNLVAIEKALHGFMEENPHITVNYEGLKGMEYWKAFDKRYAGGKLDDIIMTDHDRIVDLGQKNELVDLSQLSTIKNFDTFAKSQFTEENGAVYFLPTCVSSYGFYINLDLLKKHNKKVPTNLSELTEVCDYFVKKGITPIIANNYTSISSLIVAKGMYPTYQKEDPKAEIKKFNTGEADIVEALKPGVELVKMMIDHNWFDCKEVLETNQTSDDLNLFVKGERPFMITGGWAAPRIDNMNPQFDYKIYPYPILEDGSVLVKDVNTCISINANSKNIEEAKKLVEYMTQMDVMWEYCESQRSFTPLKDDRIPSDETVKPTSEYLRNGRYVVGSDYNLSLPLDASLRECGKEMLNGMDSEATMRRLSELIHS